MYQAIAVKYLGATNSRGSRWKATAAAGSVTIAYDHAMNADDNARTAAVRLCSKLGWEHSSDLVGGCLSDGTRVFVFPTRS